LSDGTTMNISNEILNLADACFEMYLLEELEDVSFMIEELRYCSPHLSNYENLQAIYLAQQWKNLEQQTRCLLH
jgi:hypothetical protein